VNQVVVKVLPDGRRRIHWFVRDDRGPVKTAARSEMTQAGVLRLGGAAGHVACQPGRESILPEAMPGRVVPFAHSDDPRGATCPECLATKEYADAIKALSEVEQPQLTEAQLRSVTG
jgi:hypothetical protein